MQYDEDEVMGLKAQEAKDYCIELLRELKTLTSGPISPGEAQLQELQYELKLKEAEAADNRQQEDHQRLLKELELQIEEQKTRQAQSKKSADEVRQRHVQVIQRVEENQDKLSVQLERATREHKIRMEMMDCDHTEASEKLNAELAELTERREQLKTEIESLSELQLESQEIVDLRRKLQELKDDSAKELKQLEEHIENQVFDQKKELTRVQREHELELARVQADNQKALYNANVEAADQLLSELSFERVAPDELKALRQGAADQQKRSDDEVLRIREAAINDFRRTFNITASEGEQIDVTDLYYARKSLQEENVSLEATVGKLESEISRMRSHIEKESERVAKAIEAARTNIQNNIEPGVQR
ncbi:MAG: hypothetical protein AB8G99_05005 [Planctomycetaceae bacterium]